MRTKSVNLSKEQISIQSLPGKPHKLKSGIYFNQEQILNGSDIIFDNSAKTYKQAPLFLMERYQDNYPVRYGITVLIDSLIF